MSSHPSEKVELSELLHRFHDQDVTEADLRRLDELIAVPELGVEAAHLLDTQSGLRDAVRVSGLIDASQDCGQIVNGLATHKFGLPVRGKSAQIWSLVPYLAAMLLVSNMLVGGLVWLGTSNRVADNTQDVESLPVSPALPPTSRKIDAQLVSTTSCVWSPSKAGDPTIGRSIATGEVIHLLEGIAELDLERGGQRQARIRLEGPGSLRTRRDGSISLKFGVLTAYISAGDSPFFIDTPGGKIVAKGNASLGIVANSSQHEVHVFHGDASIETISKDGLATVYLTQGEAASLDIGSMNETNVTLLEASSASFASARSMAFDRLNISQKYRDAIQESAPAIYWQFEDAGDDGIVNAGSIDGFNAYIDGSVSWRQFGDNRAAEFGLTGTVGSFVSKQRWPAKPLDSYTVELWAKPSHFHNGALIGFVAPPLRPKEVVPRYPHGMFIEFGGQLGFNSLNPLLNNVRFVHRPVPSNNRLDGTSASASGGYRARTWQHVVARKNEEVLELIIDGKVVATANDPGPLASNLQIVLGQLYPNLAHRPFVGQIDEVAIYERALSDQELKRHYKLAKPPLVFLNQTSDDSM